MSTFTNAYIEAYEAVEAHEVNHQGTERWNTWLAKYSDAAGKTPFGFKDDVYDVISDFMIFAEKNGFDFSITNELVGEAITALQQGKDPYNIQMSIDEQTKVYVEDGHIVIGHIVLEGSR